MGLILKFRRLVFLGRLRLITQGGSEWGFLFCFVFFHLFVLSRIWIELK